MTRTLGIRVAQGFSSAFAVCALLGAPLACLCTVATGVSHASPSALAPFAVQENRDVVNLTNGQTELGKIKSEDFTGLEIDPVKGSAKRIPWSEIKPNGVVYNSPEWQSITDLFAANKFADALPLLDELKADSKLRDPLRQNALYFTAVALQRQGQNDEALAAYKELVAAYPKSRYLMEAGEAMSSMLAAKKDYAGAVKLLNDIDLAAAEPSFSASAGVLKGQVFEEQKDWAKAGAAYEVASKAPSVPPGVQLQAELGAARTLAAQNKKSEAEAALTKLKAKDGPNPIMAGIWNGLADLTLERGRAANGGKGDADQLLDALYMYLRGVVQYAPLPGQSTREYERALSGSARVFKMLGDVETVADRKRLYQQRADQRLDQLKREFPNSPFVNG